ncbi:tripartite tricarboxylate transporter substrate binding protein [Arthrobacter sp. HMWF013]|uniref:tripartite tricarboxylate transporter substrate binding protein n=1 Tax=Arthrobacter sp. HMWF013 TaxID=2056849 RepID=UPI000D35FDE1|nr:tripartite tricarboxylate transporter substrate binding protein [Arthrobacter sp. HMWF013]PTT63966.1 ABC transporter substrate-binding protein [Arthrobacter sp. HMWF013]
MNSLKPTLTAITGLGILSLVLTGCGGVQTGTGGAGAGGENFPTKSVNLTAPSSAGGSTDLISRALAASIEEPLGKSVVVENKPGANTAVGTKEVLNAKADGYSTVLAAESLFAITPLFVEDPDALKMDDMTVVAPVSEEEYVLVVNKDAGLTSLADLLAKDNIKYATSGAGTGGQLGQAALFALAGKKSTDVPFDGGSAAVTALLGNHVDAVATQLAEVKPQIDAGKLVPLVVFSPERSDYFPDVPTAKESGYKISVVQRRWLAVPKETPQDVVTKLTESAETAKDSAKFQEFLKTSLIGEWEGKPADVNTTVDADTKTFSDLAKKFGIGATK